MLKGVGYDTVPETWDEIRVMLRKIKEKYAGEEVIPTSINLDLWRAVGGIYSTFTDKPYTKEGMVDLDSAAWSNALDLMKSFYTDKLAEPALLGSPDEMTTWQKGKIAVIWNYPSWLHVAQTAWGRQTYTAGLMPRGAKTDPLRTWMHVDGTYLMMNAPHPQETVDWMLTMLGPEGPASETFARGTVSRSGSPMYKGHIESKIVKGNADYPWLYDSYKMMAASTPAPLSPFHFLVDAKGKKYLPQFFKGEITAKEATQKMKEEVEQDKSKMLAGQG
jgi:ABC-type glycerol-3-phosphate transport system substrate-binding protein